MQYGTFLHILLGPFENNTNGNYRQIQREDCSVDTDTAQKCTPCKIAFNWCILHQLVQILWHLCMWQKIITNRCTIMQFNVQDLVDFNIESWNSDFYHIPFVTVFFHVPQIIAIIVHSHVCEVYVKPLLKQTAAVQHKNKQKNRQNRHIKTKQNKKT